MIPYTTSIGISIGEILYPERQRKQGFFNSKFLILETRRTTQDLKKPLTPNFNYLNRIHFLEARISCVFIVAKYVPEGRLLISLDSE
jgi:hypothetical protein